MVALKCQDRVSVRALEPAVSAGAVAGVVAPAAADRDSGLPPSVSSVRSVSRPLERAADLRRTAESLADDTRPEVRSLARALLDLSLGVSQKHALGFDRGDLDREAMRERDEGLRELRAFVCPTLKREPAARMLHEMVSDHLAGRRETVGAVLGIVERIARPIIAGRCKLPAVQHLRRNVLR